MYVNLCHIDPMYVNQCQANVNEYYVEPMFVNGDHVECCPYHSPYFCCISLYIMCAILRLPYDLEITILQERLIFHDA